MSIEDFHYRYRNPDIAAVQWTGTNRDQIREFVQLVCIEGMGWEYDKPEDAYRFTSDDDDDGTPDIYGDILVFESGPEVDPGCWLIELVHGEERYLETAKTPYFHAVFEKQP